MLLDPAIPLAQGTGIVLPPMQTSDMCGGCIHGWHGLKCRYCGCPSSFEDKVDAATDMDSATARALVGAVLCKPGDHEHDLPCQFCGAAL